jgi:AcrR family transcriptional regulator
LLFTSRPIVSVTVEEVTTRARVARGTFYSHFRTLDELRAAVAADLAAAFENFDDSIGLPIADPVARIAVGCAALTGQARRYPDWGVLIARAMRFSRGRERGAGAPESKSATCPMRRTFGLFFHRSWL